MQAARSETAQMLYLMHLLEFHPRISIGRSHFISRFPAMSSGCGSTIASHLSTAARYVSEGRSCRPGWDGIASFLIEPNFAHYPLGHLRRGGGSISALRVTGDPAKGDPRGEAPRPRPPPPSFTGVIFVTGNGDLPLATQRRVESIASDRSPFSVACAHLSAWSVVSYFLRYFS